MTDETKSPTQATSPPQLHGLLAEYGSPADLLRAAKVVRQAGFRNWDTYTPFPVHGIDQAMGIRPTILPWFVLGAGLSGLALATWLQWWTNSVDYRWLISGKPFWSIPANIPIMFELTVLLSAITAVFGMLILNGLPRPAHPLDLKQRFARASDDRFFLLIEASDANFDSSVTEQLLQDTKPAHLETAFEDENSSNEIPRGLVYTLLIVAVVALVPFAVIAKARETKTSTPMLHAVADMDWQPKYKAQRANPFFEDGRAARKPPAGTVASGDLREDAHYYTGKIDGVWANTFPGQLQPSMKTVSRGQERFGIYCTPCHGLDGQGNGLVHERATSLQQGGWVPPSDVHQEYLQTQPVGQIFNSISNGIRNMQGYKAQISTGDRWAIVMYLRALQRTSKAQSAPNP